MNNNRRIIAALCVMLLFSFSGCSVNGERGKRQEVEFTVCDDTMLPEELAKIIEEKKAKAFKLTYLLGDSLYIAIGYGEHDRNNLNIVVNDLFMTDNALYVDTELVTAEATGTDARGSASMYPYIVIKCDKTDMPVVFQVD